MAKKTVSKKVSAKKTVPVKYHHSKEVNSCVKDLLKTCNPESGDISVVNGVVYESDLHESERYFAETEAHIHIIAHNRDLCPVVTVWIDGEVVLPNIIKSFVIDATIKNFLAGDTQVGVLVVAFFTPKKCVVAIS